MEALVSPCSNKGVSERCCRTGDPPYYSRARWGGATAPPRGAAGRRSSHVASIDRGLGVFTPAPVFLRRRAVIQPTFPQPLRSLSSCFSLCADTREVFKNALPCFPYINFLPSYEMLEAEMSQSADAEAKPAQDQTQARSESLKAVAETGATDIQTQMASELLKVAAETKTANDQTQTRSELRTVHVKFKLQKLCKFGERFLLVGEDPMFGLWEPASAVPLEWSKGHVWMAELDLPVEKEIKFKFILQGLSGEIKWQPGPDRILQAWKSTNTIVVECGWENAEDQKITEEGSFAIPAERESSGQCEKEMDREIVGDQIVKTQEKNENNLIIDEEKHSDLKSDPVRVPGLPPMPTSSSVVTYQNKVDGKVDGATLASEEIDGKIPEDLPDEVDGSQHESENEHEAASSIGQLEGADSQLASGHDSEVESDPQPATNVLVNDIDWWGQTFQKFLLTLGLFRQEST